VISKINNQNQPVRCHTYARRSIHLFWTRALGAKFKLEQTIGCENLHTIIAAIRHNYVALMINSTSLRPQKLSIIGPFTAQELGRLKIRIDHQQAMIVKVRNNYLILLIEGDASWRIKLLP